MKFWFPLVGSVALLATGCANPQLMGSASVSVVPGNALPPPTRSDITTAARPYLIGPFDQVSIDVFGVPELSREVQADASGRISLPLVGAIEASGKTPAELATLIENRLRGQFVRNPQVSVNLTETVSQVITVDGEVREPGQYPVVGRMTLLRAVARARGVTEYARQTHVVVFREVGGQQMAALYDLRAIRQGLYEDPEVYASDIVTVGESQARRLFRDAIQGSSLLVTPLVALLQR